MDTASFRAAERRFAARADLVLASAPALAARMRELSRNVLYAPNVADTELFARALAPGHRRGPGDGGAAAAAHRVHRGDRREEARRAAARRARARAPAWSFALVGPVGAGDPGTDVSALRAEPNIHLLGPAPTSSCPRCCAPPTRADPLRAQRAHGEHLPDEGLRVPRRRPARGGHPAARARRGRRGRHRPGRGGDRATCWRRRSPRTAPSAAPGARARRGRHSWERRLERSPPRSRRCEGPARHHPHPRARLRAGAANLRDRPRARRPWRRSGPALRALRGGRPGRRVPRDRGGRAARGRPSRGARRAARLRSGAPARRAGRPRARRLPRAGGAAARLAPRPTVEAWSPTGPWPPPRWPPCAPAAGDLQRPQLRVGLPPRARRRRRRARRGSLRAFERGLLAGSRRIVDGQRGRHRGAHASCAPPPGCATCPTWSTWPRSSPVQPLKRERRAIFVANFAYEPNRNGLRFLLDRGAPAGVGAAARRRASRRSAAGPRSGPLLDADDARGGARVRR